ncbi:MAG: Ig-like domain-containing protein [Anaerolineae bacterium]
MYRVLAQLNMVKALLRQKRLFALIGVTLLLNGCNLRYGNVTNTPFPTPDIPRLHFLFPENNSTVLEGTDLGVNLLAEDAGIGVAQVQLLVDDTLVGEGKPEIAEAVPTFTVTLHWIAKGIGKHALVAYAFRPDGTPSAPATIVLEVVPRPETTP